MVEDSQIMSKVTAHEKRSAKRLEHNPWRDRRVILGIAIVLFTAVLGGALWIATTSSDTYWVVTQDIKAGQKVEASQVRLVELTAPTNVGQALVSGAGARPTGSWAQDLAAGSLVTERSIHQGSVDGQKLPLRLTAGAMPSGLVPGDVVNVWIGPSKDSMSSQARRVLTDVRVIHVSQDVGAGERTVLVDVGISGPTPEVIAAVSEHHITLVQVR